MPRRRIGLGGNEERIFRHMGYRICNAREKMGISSRKLADIIGVSHSYIVQMESGNKNPSVGVLVDIANALQVTTDDLLYDYVDAEKKVAASTLAEKISALGKHEQRHLEELIDIEIAYMKEGNGPDNGGHYDL